MRGVTAPRISCARGENMKLDFIEAGEIVSTHGIRGEMKVLPWSDGPDFLCNFSRVRIDGNEYKIESCRVQKNCNLLKIVGIDTMEAAHQFRGKTIEIFRSDAPKDLVFAAELIGVSVFSNGDQIGTITDVLDYPGNKVYVVKGEHEYMIPAVKAFVLNTDMERGIMEVQLIEGMGSHEN